jgi:homoserine kinase type II
VETEAGRFILTIYERRVREADLPYFLGLMHHLAKAGFPCATPVADREGETLTQVRGKPAALIYFLNGLSVRRPTAAHCAEVGAGLAQMHAAGAGFDLHRVNDLGLTAWRPLFDPNRAAAERLESGLDARIASDLAALEAAWPGGLPSGSIHADLFPDNAFFARGKFCGAIDFYFACDDAFAYDLAVCLNAWCFDAEHRFLPDHAKALVDGYQATRPLSAQELTALPVLARGAAMRFFLTRLADWERGAAGALVTPKNPMDYAKRLDAHRSGVVEAVL